MITDHDRKHKMRFHAAGELSERGEYVATCLQPSLPGRGLSPTNVLDPLRRELRYQLELRPCSGIDPHSIEFDASSEGLCIVGSSFRATVLIIRTLQPRKI